MLSSSTRAEGQRKTRGENNSMRTIGLACVAIAVGLAGAWTLAAPQSKAAATDTILTQVTVDDLKGILTEWGATEISAAEARTVKGADGAVTLTIRVLTFRHSGLLYAARMYCVGESTGCLGIQLTVAFENAGTPLTVLNGFNGSFRAGKAYQETQVYVSERYIIVDHGVARANIMTQFVVHEAVTANMLKYIKDNGVIAQVPGARPIPVALPHMAQGSTVHMLTVQDVKTPINRVAP